MYQTKRNKTACKHARNLRHHHQRVYSPPLVPVPNVTRYGKGGGKGDGKGSGNGEGKGDGKGNCKGDSTTRYGMV